MLSEFQYIAPKSRTELFDILADEEKGSRILAGGTDLLVNIRNGVMSPERLVDLKRVDGYSGITWSETEGLVLRPSVTINEVLKNKIVKEHFPLLQECGHDLASYQVRNRATVTGNVVNASPCSDMAPALLCLNAEARITSARGERSVLFSDFFTGVKKTVLSADEVLEAIVIPPASAGARGSYQKLKRINGHDLGIVGVAVSLLGGSLSIAVSSSAPTPVLVDGLDPDISVEEAIEKVSAVISPISDVRCTAEYRRFMVNVFIRRQLTEVRK